MQATQLGRASRIPSVCVVLAEEKQIDGRGEAKPVPTGKEMFQNWTVSFLGKEGSVGKEERGLEKTQ